ncbi:MAG: hypothetical protein ACLR8L_08090 [Oscillospiraceae bacterium]
MEAACFYEKLPDGETLEAPTVITLFAGTGSYEIERLQPPASRTLIRRRTHGYHGSRMQTSRRSLRTDGAGAGKGYDPYLLL